MRRYFDARANPVNEELIQRMNKLPTGAARTGEGDRFGEFVLPAESLLFKQKETVLPLVPKGDRQFLNEHPNYKYFGEARKKTIAAKVNAKEKARRVYEPSSADDIAADFKEMREEAEKELRPVNARGKKIGLIQQLKEAKTEDERKAIKVKLDKSITLGRQFGYPQSEPPLLRPAGNARKAEDRPTAVNVKKNKK